MHDHGVPRITTGVRDVHHAEVMLFSARMIETQVSWCPRAQCVGKTCIYGGVPMALWTIGHAGLARGWIMMVRSGPVLLRTIRYPSPRTCGHTGLATASYRQLSEQRQNLGMASQWPHSNRQDDLKHRCNAPTSGKRIRVSPGA